MALCLTLAGCPSGSNPTKPQNPSAGAPGSTPVPPGGSGTNGTGKSSGTGAESQTQGNTEADTEADAKADKASEQQGATSTGHQTSTSGSQDNGSEQEEPGFGDGETGGAGLPDLSDGADQGGGSQQARTDQRNSPENNSGAAETATSTLPGTAAVPTAGAPVPGIPGSLPGPGGSPAGNPTAQGPLTPQEQVAILEGELARGTGEFDQMILETQEDQRQTQRERAKDYPPAAEEPPPENQRRSEYGAGSGRTAGQAPNLPSNTAKYPPPADIPSGNDDDVVARQLREAAMREPDPEVREKLWAEYRKYKGIDQ